MQALAEPFDPAKIEAATRAFWASRRAVAAGADLGPPGAPLTQQFLGTVFPSDDRFALWHREVVADAEARYLAMAGRRSRSSVQIVASREHVVDTLLGELTGGGIHLGPEHALPGDPASLAPEVQRMVGRLASRGLLVVREQVALSCPRCLVPRTPEGVVYQRDVGTSLLVRFPLRGSDPVRHLIVATDYAWRLLGTTAVGVSPTATYVTGRFRRKDLDESIVLAKSAIPRLAEWLPGGTFEPTSEAAGSELAGAAYVHPLSVEYPTVGNLPAPAGAVVALEEVDEKESGLVALVPSHGLTDAAVAARVHLPGLPVTTSDARIERVVMHKYAGLPLEIGDAFIHRDLNDGGSLFAEIRAARGVPHCAACGSPLLWIPARTWYLDPSRLAPELIQSFHRLLPEGPDYPAAPSLDWVAAKVTPSPGGDDPVLLECDRCDRLAPPEESGPCPCGGTRQPVARGLATALREAVHAWARLPSGDPGDTAVLYLPERRLAPAVLHHLVALEAAGRTVPELRLVRIPSVRGTVPAADAPGVDARRVALVSLPRSPRVASTLPDRERREARRLARAWNVVRIVIDQMLADGYRPETDGAASHRSELLEEDAAFLSAFERMRATALDRFRDGRISDAAALLGNFFERELRGGYLRDVGARLRSPGLGPLKLSAYRVLNHVLPLWAELYAPFAPFTMEAVLRALRDEPTSVFERRLTPARESLIDPRAEEAANGCREVVSALARGRKMFGIGREARLASAVIVVREEPVAAHLRASQATLTRLATVTQLTLASPAQPWEGAQVVTTPVVEELQRAYPSQGPRLARLLQQVKPRRIQEGLAAGNLTVVLDGGSVQILPAMVEISESLPENTVAVPWRHGEIYMTLPPRLYEGADAPPPAVSADATQLLRETRRRLRRRASISGSGRAVIHATGSLGTELARRTKSIARYLGLGSVEVVASADRFAGNQTVRGRTRRGDRWSVWLPGGDLPIRSRHPRTPRSALPRVRLLERGQEANEPDVLGEETIRRAEQVRALVETLDGSVGRPIVGPTKLGHLWDAGIHDVEGLRAASFDAVSAIPGFGPYVTEALFRSVGGVVPVKAPRPRATLTAPIAEVVQPEAPVTPPPIASTVAPPTAPPAPPVPPPEFSTPPVGAPPAPAVAPVAPPPPSVVPTAAMPAPQEFPLRPAMDESAGEAPPADALRPPIEYAVETVAIEPLVVPTSTPSAPERRFGVEVWPGPSSEPAWRRFLDMTGLGVRGLCFTREFPDRIRGAIGSRVVDVAWLSNTGREGSVRPGDLSAIQGRIASALNDTRVRAVYLGGMEYLVSLHGREKVGTFLQAISDLAGPVRARIWVPMNPALVVPGAAEEFAAQFPADVSP